MIPLLLGVQPAQNTAQPTKAGSGDSGSAFEDLLASMVPAEQDSAHALGDTAAEPEVEEKIPAGTGGEAFGELQLQERLATLGTSILSVAQANPATAGTAAMTTGNAAAPTVVDPVTSTIVDAAAPATDAATAPAEVGAAATGEPGLPWSLVAVPSAEAVAPTDPIASAAVSDVDAESTAPVGTNPGMASLVSTATPGTRTNTGVNAQPAADEGAEPATVSVDEVPAESQGPAVELEAQPAGLAPEGKSAQPTPTPGFQVPAHDDAARAARPETLLGVGAVSGGKTLAVENVVSREPQALPINRQLVGPISALATGPHGDRTLSVNIAPEALGPITVKAHLGHEGMRVELSAPTEAGREALRAMLPELRRDLAATGAGTITVGTATDAGTGAGTFSGGGQASMANDHRFGGGSTASAGPGRQQDEDSAPSPAHDDRPSAHASSHLDVMA